MCIPGWPAVVRTAGISAICLLLLATTACAESAAEDNASARWQWQLPVVALHGVPVESVHLSLVNKGGQPLSAVSGAVRLRGIHVEHADGETVLLTLTAGELTLRTDRQQGRRVYITSAEVSVEFTDNTAALPEVTSDSATTQVRLLPAWLSLLPPLLAIALAVWCKEVFTALLAAITVGTCLLTPTWWLGPLRVFDTLLIDVLADRGHLEVILFTLLVGGMIGVMSHSGGTAAVVGRLVRRVETRERGQVLTWFLGLFVFFDDYANTMIVGGTMRPVADRLKFSRAKLAFLVDSTAAPVAGLALISTWVGVERGYIESGLKLIEADSNQAFSLLAYSLPYRLYPLLLLLFVGMIAYTGRDFGSMRTAEQEAFNNDDGESSAETSDRHTDSFAPSGRLIDALLPLSVLLLCVAVGMFIAADQSATVLLLASAAAAIAAVVTATTGTRSLKQSVEWLLLGIQSMLPAVIVMVLAWSLAAICATSQLNTAGYLVEFFSGSLQVEWLPALTFLLAAAIAFSTGTSFGTMGLLMPMAIVLTQQLLAADLASEDIVMTLAEQLRHPILLATIGSVLAGSIFGDHCSPVSDTTVLSSAACGCDHLEHVRTQLPYALTVGCVTVVCGLIPVGFGVSVWLLLPLNLALLVLIVRCFGKRPQIVQAAQPVSSSLPE